MQRNKHKYELQKSDAEGTDMENVIKLDVGRLRQRLLMDTLRFHIILTFLVLISMKSIILVNIANYFMMSSSSLHIFSNNL